MGVPQIWVYAHAALLDGDHTTALSGTLWRHTLRLMLARADSVKVAHSSDYITGAVDLDLQELKDGWVRSTEVFNLGETEEMHLALYGTCRYTPRRPLVSRPSFVGLGRM